jgi:YHS domain-containing protein
MARFILLILFLLLLYAILYYFIKDMAVGRKKWSRESEPEELVQDPYCQTYIPKRSAVRKKISGSMLYFCNRECLKNYLKRDKKNR